MRVAWHACYEWGTSRHEWWGTAMLGTVEFDILVVRKYLGRTDPGAPRWRGSIGKYLGTPSGRCFLRDSIFEWK
jgi:hypothetical protein